MATTVRLDANGISIVEHSIMIRRGIQIGEYGLENYLKSIFSQYGKIWNYTTVKKLVFISYNNAKSRNLAVQKTDGILNTNNNKLEKLSVWAYHSKLNKGMVLIKRKLQNPQIDINDLMNCNNYWDKDLYPINIVEAALKTGVSVIRQTLARFHVYCYHKDIEHPFIIHMAAESKSKQHIIHIRPQTIWEIRSMLATPNLALLKRLIPKNYAFNTDWRCYTLWRNTLLSDYATNEAYPYECMKYMLHVIGCDARNPKHKLLHIAAGRHDMNLLTLMLETYHLNPLQIEEEFQATALKDCEYHWNRYQIRHAEEEIAVADENVVKFTTFNETDNNKQGVYCTRIYIQSILLKQLLFVQNFGHISVCDVPHKFRFYAQFSLHHVGNNGYIIKIGKYSPSYDRICGMKGLVDMKCDIVLTADLNNKTVEMLPYKHIEQQHWFIDKQMIANGEWYKFYVSIQHIKQYQLIAAYDNTLKLEEVDITNNEFENDEKEGRNLDDVTNSLFVILKKPKFSPPTNYEFEQNQAGKASFLKGDIEKCRRIHQQIVAKLQKAMKIQKLYGDNIKNDHHKQNYENDEKANKISCATKSMSKNNKYKPPKTIHKYNASQRFSKNCHYDKQKKSHRYKGICKKYDTSKGFGFITVNDGSGDIFVHYSEIKAQGLQSLLEGENVEFEIVVQDDGRRKATNVTGPNGGYVTYGNVQNNNNYNVNRDGYVVNQNKMWRY